MTARVLVTGASGFLGTHLVARLLSEGRTVGAFLPDDAGAPGFRERLARLASFLGFGIDPARLVEIRGGFDDPWLMRTLVAEWPGWIHTAGTVQGDLAPRFEAGNPGLVRRLLATPGWTAGHRVIHVSSVAAQGPGGAGRPAREDDPPRPQGLYGTSKRAAEELLLGSPAPFVRVVVRPCSILGPGDPHFLGMFEAARRGLYVKFVLPEQRFQTVYAPDLASFMTRLMTRLEAGTELPAVIQVGDPRVLHHRDLAAALGRAMGHAVRTVRLPAFLAYPYAAFHALVERWDGRARIPGLDKLRDLATPCWVHDFGRAEAALGPLAWTPIEEVCRRVDRWYRETGAYGR